jgi:hypothetical protein
MNAILALEILAACTIGVVAGYNIGRRRGEWIGMQARIAETLPVAGDAPRHVRRQFVKGYTRGLLHTASKARHDGRVIAAHEVNAKPEAKS